MDLLVFRIDARTHFRVGLGLETLAILVDGIQHVALLVAFAVFNYDDAILFHLDGQPATLAGLADSIFADAALGAIDSGDGRLDRAAERVAVHLLQETATGAGDEVFDRPLGGMQGLEKAAVRLQIDAVPLDDPHLVAEQFEAFVVGRESVPRSSL